MAVKGIAAGPAIKSVVAGTADESVVAGSAGEGLGLSTGVEIGRASCRERV